MLVAISPTLTIAQNGTITTAEVAWWTQEVAAATISSMTSALILDLALLVHLSMIGMMK